MMQMPQSETESLKGLNFFALLPCPVKVPFEDKFKTFAERLYEEKHCRINYRLVSNANHHLSFADSINHAQSIDDLPDIMMAPGFNLFFGKEFLNNFVSKSCFADVLTYGNRCKSAGICDPEGNYSTIASNSLIIAADTTKLHRLPSGWSELLLPEYENKLVIRGDRNSFCETVLTYFFKDFGEEGIRELARSVALGMHPAQMVKTLNDGHKEDPAIFVMPYFYSKMIQNSNVSTIWPKEGALFNPIFVLVKRDKRDELRDLIAFLSGPIIADVINSTGFPSAVKDVELKPRAAGYKWLGWDYIKSHDIGREVREQNECFVNYFNGVPCLAN